MLFILRGTPVGLCLLSQQRRKGRIVMNIFPLVVSWAILASGVAGLAFYRKLVARKEDDFLHVDARIENQQRAVAKKLEAIDKWGKLLTIIAGVFTIILIAAMLYNGWNSSSTLSN